MGVHVRAKKEFECEMKEGGRFEKEGEDLYM